MLNYGSCHKKGRSKRGRGAIIQWVKLIKPVSQGRDKRGMIRSG